MSDNYNTILKDGKYCKEFDDKHKGVFEWVPAFNFGGPSTFKRVAKEPRSNSHDYWLKKKMKNRERRKMKKAERDELIILKRMAV